MNPIRRSTAVAGQNPVNADWIRFTPTNALRRIHIGSTNRDNTTPTRTIVPASTRIPFSIFMSL